LEDDKEISKMMARIMAGEDPLSDDDTLPPFRNPL
jgi:hypothetical protein